MSAGPGEATRNRLLAIVRERGGLHKSELMRLAGKGWGNIGHHLDVLVQEGLVETQTRGRLLWVFDPAVTQHQRELIIAMRPGAARRILEHLGLRERATVSNLSEELAVSKKVIRMHLSTLQRAQAVTRLEGHPPAFAPKPAEPMQRRSS